MGWSPFGLGLLQEVYAWRLYYLLERRVRDEPNRIPGFGDLEHGLLQTENVDVDE